MIRHDARQPPPEILRGAVAIFCGRSPECRPTVRDTPLPGVPLGAVVSRAGSSRSRISRNAARTCRAMQRRARSNQRGCMIERRQGVTFGCRLTAKSIHCASEHFGGHAPSWEHFPFCVSMSKSSVSPGAIEFRTNKLGELPRSDVHSKSHALSY